MITGENYIGTKRSAQGSKIFKTFDPVSNTENEPQFHEASTEEIDKAVALAWKALHVIRIIQVNEKVKS